MGCAAYRFEPPKKVLVTTAEGDSYSVEVSAGANDGVVINYHRVAEPPEGVGDEEEAVSPEGESGRIEPLEVPMNLSVGD